MAPRISLLLAVLFPLAASANGLPSDAHRSPLEVVVVVDAVPGSEWVVLPRAAAIVPGSVAAPDRWPTALAGTAIGLMLALAGLWIARRRRVAVRATTAGLALVVGTALGTGIAVANGMPWPREPVMPATVRFTVPRVEHGVPGVIELHLSEDTAAVLRGGSFR